MKISYNWLKTLINTDLSPEEAARLLTAAGLEVESMDAFESVQGALKGVVVGEVMEKAKHPDADRLNLTKVNVGSEKLLSIVCGAPNVEAGQKVLVATVGSRLYPTSGDPIDIKKSKIRGAESEGMICAEDEIGVGNSHAGIMVLPPDTKVGMQAADYFKIESDTVFEIGLTPNRADAASHLGVARDLYAITKTQNPEKEVSVGHIGIHPIPRGAGKRDVKVSIETPEGCKRYSGIVIDNIKVGESPAWLQNRLKSIGLRPINNVVDITNFVLHELGQPLHAFDLDKIKGNKVIVKTCAAGTVFKTLDGVERKLDANDLMICNEKEPMCIAGVFGGLDSGVTNDTKAIFLESAYFDAGFIRRTGKRHGLKTDASFRFERGTDPEMTVTALQRAVGLILDICGGEPGKEVIDLYPEKLEPYKVTFSYTNACELIGKNIDRSIIKNIILLLGMEIVSEGNDGLLLNVPRYKTDVTREADVTEEVMRIYGYNNVESSTHFRFAIPEADASSSYKLENTISQVLCGSGYSEIMSLSLSSKNLYNENESLVNVVNPLSQDLNVLRGNMLYSGLEAIRYNISHKNGDLKLFEFGKTYNKTAEGYSEKNHLSIFVTGKKINENPYGKAGDTDFAYLKASVEAVLKRLGLDMKSLKESDNKDLSFGLNCTVKNKTLVEFGAVSKANLKKCDVGQQVFYADFDLDLLQSLAAKQQIEYKEIPKFPAVRRDLALLLDKTVKYNQVEELAYQAERKYLKDVNLFDVYEGDKIASGKKSYAVSFTLLNEEQTLTDKQIDAIMQKLINTYKEKLSAELRA